MKYFVEQRCCAPGHEGQEGCFEWWRYGEDYYETKQHAEGEIWALELEQIFYKNDPEMDEYRIISVEGVHRPRMPHDEQDWRAYTPPRAPSLWQRIKRWWTEQGDW